MMWGLQCYWEWREMEEHTVHKPQIIPANMTTTGTSSSTKQKKKHRLVQWKRKQRPEYGQLTLKNFKKCYFFVETSCHQCTTGRQRWGKWTHRTTNVQYSQPTFDNCGGIHAINSLHNQVTGKQFLSIMQGVVQSFIKWCNHANQNWTEKESFTVSSSTFQSNDQCWRKKIGIYQSTTKIPALTHPPAVINAANASEKTTSTIKSSSPRTGSISTSYIYKYI